MMLCVANPDDSGAPGYSAVEMARAGEAAGFDQLFREHAGSITAFARSRGATDPEGICNETFLRAFRSLDTFDGDDAAFRRWVFSICRNLIIDAHRARERRPVEVLAEPPEVSAAGADEIALMRLGDENVRRLLAPLTDDQREVILLRLVADLTLAETAEIVGRPVSAVKRLQARGLKRLQSKILGEEVS